MEMISITDLKAKGYQESMLRELSHRKIFKEIGYRNDKKRSKIYFFQEKLDGYLAEEMERR